MTNIIASVIITLVTNVANIDNGKGCSMCDTLQKQAISGGPVWAVYHPAHGGLPYVPATEKSEITTISRHEVLTFTWQERQWSVTNIVVLSEKKRTFKLSNSWVEVK